MHHKEEGHLTVWHHRDRGERVYGTMRVKAMGLYGITM